MNGGKISGNTAATYGGGVYNNSTFTMSGGSISGNTADSGGGGVAQWGTFRLITGTIYGNDAAGALKNNAANGVALRTFSGSSQCGTFSGETWNGGTSLSGSIDDTITVVNGVRE